MPEVTVAMPARNRARYVRSAIESVLSQADVDFEIVVVDDASEDETAEIVASMRDPRLRLLRNATRMGIGHCHNQVVRSSSGPFIAHVDSDDLLMPGALAKTVAALRSSPDVGQTHCHYFFVREDGSISRRELRRQHALYGRIFRPEIDYKRRILVEGTMINALRTYRRDALAAVGPFNEELASGIDYEMGLRLLDRYRIRVVPEFLYAYRTHAGRTSEYRRFSDLRQWATRFRICRRLMRTQQVAFLAAAPVHRLLALSLLRSLTRGRARMQPALARLAKRSSGVAYEGLVRLLRFWPSPRAAGAIRGRPPRIGYVAWSFPGATFIAREVEALRGAGLDVRVFAQEIDAAAAEGVCRFGGGGRGLLPFHLGLFLFVLSRRYGRFKRFKEDLAVYRMALELAGRMRAFEITHAHSPWTDQTAFVTLVAARMLGVPHSVQARAHDLHRRGNRTALGPIFQNAAFIATNAQYNVPFIASHLRRAAMKKLHVVREGVPVAGLRELVRPASAGAPFTLLAVARIVEEKGLASLLEASRLLLDSGHAFRCEIVGGAEEPLYTSHHLELKKRHRRLGLESHVFFLGAQPFAQVREAYRRADIFVLPCVVAASGGRDVTPNAIMEAMAAGLPVVSTALSAIPELIEDGVDGILVPPGDARALAAAIERLMADRQLRQTLGDSARLKAEREFDIARNLPDLVRLFREP